MIKDKIEKKIQLGKGKKKTQVNQVISSNSQPKSWDWDNLIKIKLKKIMNKPNMEERNWNWKIHKKGYK